MNRLKTLLSAISDSYPTRLATSDSVASEARSNQAAFRARHFAKYLRGGSPTSSWNRAENEERDIPTLDAKELTCQSCSGCW